MITQEQLTPATGSVPNAFGNALAWKWTRQMPAALRRGGFLTLLYALRAMASASGELRFHGDRKPIRIQDLAAAAGADEKDTRRYLKAAQKAGVVVALGEQRRGRPTLYAIVLAPFPDWDAAAAHLAGTKRIREQKPAPWAEEKNGGWSPELSDPKFGGPTPELSASGDNKVRGTNPRMSSGDQPPNGSGDQPPNNPGVTHDSSHDGAGSSSQPKLVGADDLQPIEPNQEQDPHDEPPPAAEAFARCTDCHAPIAPDPKRPGRTIHTTCQRRAEKAAS
ncbi:hypothetical protein ABZY90_19735 [Streptomyces sp. NPDC006422]|uniref:hypothetical protein n=1 Tax=unclassified Streptomyces TaxID=2593676 RepID=UPI0033BAB81A